jgi:hypothetical protein
MDRHQGRVFFTWLPIGRCDPGDGSSDVATSSGAGWARKRQYRGNEAFDAVVVFPQQRAYQKKIPAATPAGEGYCPFAEAIPLQYPARYTRRTNSSVT